MNDHEASRLHSAVLVSPKRERRRDRKARKLAAVPRPFGALILKSAAYTTDSRDKERHLFDAAALLACIDDPFAERAEFTGSDRRRIATLATRLDGAHPAWRALPEYHRTQAQLTLELLARSDEDSATGGPTAAPA